MSCGSISMHVRELTVSLDSSVHSLASNLTSAELIKQDLVISPQLTARSITSLCLLARVCTPPVAVDSSLSQVALEAASVIVEDSELVLG